MNSDGEPAPADIEKAYPQWRTWVGVDRLCHALRTRGAALTASGEDWRDLMDEIKRAEAFLQDSRPAGWPASSA